MKIVILLLALLMAFPALAQKKVAVVKLLKGTVEVLTLGKTSKLLADQWVEEGSVIRTGKKSFVKLIFLDKSQMNIGPQSQMKIEKFTGKDSSVIDLVKGKIRSQVTKDYLQMGNKNKSKLFIKTKNAVMGVRGTDFLISTNGKSSSVVLFEGEVVFNKLEEKISNSDKLEEIVDSGVKLYPGEFSVVNSKLEPTVPAILNPQQREAMEKNENLENKDVKDNEKKTKSIVPEGLTGDVVGNESETLKKEVLKGGEKIERPSFKHPEGFVDGEKIKPANGSFLHVDSGIIIPPAPDSMLDKNTNTFVAGSGNGSVLPNGDYQPPKNVTITEEGKFIMHVKDDAGKVKQHEIEKPMPVRLPEEFALKLSEIKQPQEMVRFQHPGPGHEMNKHHGNFEQQRLHREMDMKGRMEDMHLRDARIREMQLDPKYQQLPPPPKDSTQLLPPPPPPPQPPQPPAG